MSGSKWRQEAPTSGGSSTSNRRRIGAVTIGCLGLGAWLLFVPGLLARGTLVFGWDSAPYVEAADSLLAGRGLMQREIFGLGPTIWVPIRNWPPLYSILIACGRLVGMSGPVAAVSIAVASGAIFIMLLAAWCSQRFHWAIALPLVLSVVWMPAFLHITTTALSDAPYLTLASASLLCLIGWSDKTASRSRLPLAAGFFAGCAWATRYAGLGLLASSALFIGLHALWRPRREVASAGWRWLAGASVTALPLVVRNLWLFGKVSPFDAAPSDVPLIDIVVANGAAAVSDLTASPRVARMVENPMVLVLGLVVFALFVGAVIRKSSVAERQSVLAEWRLELLLAVYVAAHTVLLVAARYTFALTDPPAGGAPRHFGQIYWVLWVLFALIASRLQVVGPRVAKACVITLTAAFCVIAVRQARAALREFDRLPVSVMAISANMDEDVVRLLARDVAEEQIIVAPRAFLYRLFAGVNARKVAMREQCPYQPCFTRTALRASGSSGLLWGVVIDDVEGARDGRYGPLFQSMLAVPEQYPEYSRIPTLGSTLVLKFRPTSADPAGQTP